MTPCPDCADKGWNLQSARIQVCDCGRYDPPRWVQRGETACVINHRTDPDRPRRAYVGMACAGHRAKLEEMISSLPGLYDDLGVALTSSERHAEEGKRKHGATSAGLALNGKVVDAREEIHAELVRMVREIVEERLLHALPADEVSAMCSWLTSHVDWMCERLDIDETHDNLDRLTRAVYSLAFPSGRRWIEIGPCTTDGCEGTLTTVTSRTADLLPESIWCTDCDQRIRPAQWRQLRRDLGDEAEVVLTVTQAADTYDVPFRTLSRWLADGRLCDVADGYPAKVRAAEVEEIMQNMGVIRDSA